MKTKTLLTVLLASVVALQTLATTTSNGRGKFFKATDSNISFTGRTLSADDGRVSFDWTGVYLQTRFTGRNIGVMIAETDTAWYNVFIDGKLKDKIKIFGREPHAVSLAEKLPAGRHELKLQRCTEGQYSRTTVYGLNADALATLTPVARKSRFIEVYGDSYTCGFGVESNRAEDPFLLSTENCNDAYACLVARYFDADYALIAHSGQGIIRDWAAEKTSSPINMLVRHDRIFDDHDTLRYAFDQYHPDLVIINLGTNDFSPVAIPTPDEFTGNYLSLIRSLRSHYGNVPILCVTPHSASTYLLAAMQELGKKVADDHNVYMAEPMTDIIRYGYDFGASWHPNKQGQKKIAMTLIPRISAIMHWPIK